MKYLAILSLILAGCASKPVPKPDPAPTAMLVRSMVFITDAGPIRRCTYTIFGLDVLIRTSDYCPLIIEVTQKQVQEARDLVEGPVVQ